MRGTELIFQLEVNSGSGTVVDYNSAALVLKGKQIVFHINEQKMDPNSFESPVDMRSRFIHVPIQTSTPAETVYTWQVAKMKTTEDLFQPFHDRADGEYLLEWIEPAPSRIIQNDNKIVASVAMDQNHVKKEIQFRAENSAWGYTALVGGFAIVLYYVFNCMVCCCVSKKFENYLVSELYTAADPGAAEATGDGVDGEEDEPVASGGCCSCRSAETITRKRMHKPSNFHNEIFGEDEKILNRSKVGCSYRWCRYMLICCRRRRHIEKVFMKGRRLTAQELNITSLIKAQRQSAALCEVLNKEDKVINRHVRRAIVVEDDAEGAGNQAAHDDENPKGAGDTTQKPDASTSQADAGEQDKLMSPGKGRSDSVKKKSRGDDDGDEGRRGGRSRGRDKKRHRDDDDDGDRDRRRRDRDDGGESPKRRERRHRDDDDGDRDRDRDRRHKSRGGSKKRD